MKVKLRKTGSLCGAYYEVNFGTEKWYHIHRRNIETTGAAELIRNLFNACLLGLVATVKGAYNRKTRKLKLTL